MVEREWNGHLEDVLERAFFLHTKPECLRQIEDGVQLLFTEHVDCQNVQSVQSVVQSNTGRNHRPCALKRSRSWRYWSHRHVSPVVLRWR